jgi:hypothetical protein
MNWYQTLFVSLTREKLYRIIPCDNPQMSLGFPDGASHKGFIFPIEHLT